MLRVLVDAHMVGRQETGNETYIVNLLAHMAQLREVRCGAVVTPGVPLPHTIIEADIDLLFLRSNSNWRRILCTLGHFCQEWRADILHTTYVGPPFLPCCHVTTVHDVSFRRYPQFFSLRDRILFATLLPLTLRRVDGVITVSQHAKREVLHFYPFLEGKVYVTLEAVSDFFSPVTDARLLSEVRDRYGIAGRFILAVGNLQPRKNLVRLVEAFSKIARAVPDLQLVVVGKAEWRSSVIFSLVRALGIEQRVVFTGYIPNGDLKLLYSAAEVFVYPSIYEGFGLPVLEAMACGSPVVASKTSSIPEVTGEAALLVDPLDIEGIVHSILRIIEDEDLQAELSRKGLRRAKQFSWDRLAADTVEVYKMTVNQR